MLDWLQESVHSNPEVPLDRVAIRLVLALLLGAVVAGVYLATQPRERSKAASVAPTLVLLTILIALVTQVIGNNAARAFSLVGALAIIRFRTVVEDTRDTAFVIFAVAIGMAVGAALAWVAVIGTVVVSVAAALMAALGRRTQPLAVPYRLVLRLGCGHDPDAVLRDPFTRHLSRWQLMSTATARQGAALDLSYTVCLRDEGGAIAFVSELNQREGVQSVELQRL